MYKNLIFILMLMFSVSILGCENNDKEVNNNQNLLNEKSQIVNGDEEKAPEFTLNTTEGNQISLSDYRGKVVILDFWATWCPPCRKGIPDLIELQKEYKGDIVIIGISLDQETKKDVVPFIKNYGINYPVVFGNMDIVQNYGNIRSIPTSFIIDQEGNIITSYVGLRPKATYVKEIEALMRKS